TVEKVETDPARAEAPCLSDHQLKALAALAKTAERHYGCPQDIEWAVDADLADGDNVILLQARPETVWSKKPRQSVAGSADKNPMASIVSTLMNPLYARKD
ncbi:MAG: PEP/pyruvate-binding domain-containing protein, partial [Phycisphaerales bacterium]